MGATVTITGYAAKDAEVKEAGQSSYAKFSIANNYKVKDEEKKDWYQIKVWGKLGDYAAKIKKGYFVVASGTLTTFETESGKYFEVDTKTISFVKPAPKEEAPPQAVRKAPPPSDEDVPW